MTDGRSERDLDSDTDRRRRLIVAAANTIIAHADELTALDSAIGDGDHGHNMVRGLEAILQDVDTIARSGWPEMAKAVGTKLVMKVGGASGPLYGTLFLALGKALPPEPSREDAAAAFAAAISAVRARGKSELGQKTMLDVLIPALGAFSEGGDLGSIKKVAADAAEATAPMRATRGRASFLGERSIGHVDPGARSSSLLVAALCDAWGKA
jgi:dihydroxyacetone kinase-like protein